MLKVYPSSVIRFLSIELKPGKTNQDMVGVVVNSGIKDLPPPSAGRVGWPWTEESLPLPETMADGSPWPRVSIVTPSYNQGQFIEETIRSVLLQGYPNLEYIIIDGGSTDESVDIIRKYEPWLTYWVSEPDRGQSHGINKGWQRATGDIWAWLNSDDFYYPEAIRRAVEALQQNLRYDMVYSDGMWIDETSLRQKPLPSAPRDARSLLTEGNGIPQPTAFIRGFAVKKAGGLDESLHMAMDFDLWVKLAFHGRLSYVKSQTWAMLRAHPLKKTSTRVLEDLECNVKVIDRACNALNCPHSIARRGNSLYSWLYLEIATFNILNHINYYHALYYFYLALTSYPKKTLQRLFYKLNIGFYHIMIPNYVQKLIRQLRGTDKEEWLK